jgi:hypothetical protein
VVESTHGINNVKIVVLCTGGDNSKKYATPFDMAKEKTHIKQK